MSDPKTIKTRLIASLMQFFSEELKDDELSLESKDSIEGKFFKIDFPF